MKKKGGKLTNFEIPRSDVCPCRSAHELGSKRDLNSSWSQKLKQIFESRKCPNEPNAEILFDKMNHEKPSKNNEIKVIKYEFVHGSPEYYKTFDCPPHLISDVLAEQTVHHATRFWAEMFGFINIGVTFFVTFLLQFYR